MTENKGGQLGTRVSKKNADELKQLMIDADSMLTLFAFSPHIFLQEDKFEERKKEAQRIGFALRKLKASIFSC